MSEGQVRVQKILNFYVGNKQAAQPLPRGRGSVDCWKRAGMLGMDTVDKKRLSGFGRLPKRILDDIAGDFINFGIGRELREVP
jgi:hypothetical protein